VKFVDNQIRILINELKKRGGSANYGELFAATDGVMPALSATLQVGSPNRISLHFQSFFGPELSHSSLFLSVLHTRWHGRGAW